MSKRYRFFIILAVVGVCLIFLYPTARWYFFVPKDEQNLALGSREQIRDYARQTALLDLQRLIDASRRDAPLPEDLAFLVSPAERLNKINGEKNPAVWNAREVVRAFNRKTSGESDARAQMQDIIETRYRNRVLALKRLQQNAVQLGLDLSGGLSIVLQGNMEALDARFQEQYERNPTDAEREVIFDQALTVLNSRIDRFGLTEPVIRKQGADQIYVEIPGTADPERINDIIRGKGGLSFHVVDWEATSSFNAYLQQNPGFVPNEDGTLPISGIVADDVLVFGLYENDRYGIDERIGYMAVKKEVGLDGNHIRNVFVQRDQKTTKPQVTFYLGSEGGEIFYNFTKEHVQESMATVLDNRIKFYATINEAIRDAVQVTGMDIDEANNFALTLRTAALPVELEVVSQQSIGPALGEDIIRQGLYALLGGLSAVMFFMLLYYKAAGFNAVVAQILNIYLMFSILSAFNFTLTLPSIAGFILTIGMAVDANVIIFERMKEELKLGKGRQAAVNAGFNKAFWAIMDSNITTFIAAMFLSQLGTGPIKGFAVSLAIGVFSSVFTALFVSRLIFDFGTDVLGSKKLSVGWFSYDKAAKGRAA
ncbi:MAG: protein translocase subunit SecD [Treponema sp.]|jgi:preprotein translocase subunit SecD|nr:protein translocase subunit SecD [Treponema sp.]